LSGKRASGRSIAGVNDVEWAVGGISTNYRARRTHATAHHAPVEDPWQLAGRTFDPHLPSPARRAERDKPTRLNDHDNLFPTALIVHCAATGALTGTSCELAGHKVDYLLLLDDAFESLAKLGICRILIQVIRPVLSIFKLTHKDVRDAVLYGSLSAPRTARQFPRHATTLLQPLTCSCSELVSVPPIADLMYGLLSLGWTHLSFSSNNRWPICCHLMLVNSQIGLDVRENSPLQSPQAVPEA
jgi:hypothetical protein